MQDNKINSLIIEYIFKIYLEEKEVCRVHYKETLFDEEATLEVFDEDNLPVEIKIGTRETGSLICFLQDRVLPPNRMFLEKQLKPLGISADDWVEKIKLNKGRVYGDEYWVEVEQAPAAPPAPSEQVATGTATSEGSGECQNGGQENNA